MLIFDGFLQNASSDYLDLSVEHARAAKDMRGIFAINTDSYDKSRLKEMRFGITNA